MNDSPSNRPGLPTPPQQPRPLRPQQPQQPRSQQPQQPQPGQNGSARTAADRTAGRRVEDRADRRPDAARPGRASGPAGGPGRASAADTLVRPDRRRRPGGPVAGVGVIGRLPLTIGAKLSLLTGGMVAVLVVSSLLLILAGRSSSATYNELLKGPVAQSLAARKMQVEFKKQVQDWKDILLRGFKQADMATYTGQFRAEDVLVNEINADMIASAVDPALKAQLVSFRDAHRDLDANYTRALSVFQADNGANPTVPDKMVRGLDRAPTDLIDTIVSQLETKVTDAVARQEAETTSRNRSTVIAGTGVLLILVGILALAVLSIVRPIRRLTRDAFAVATERLPAAIARVKAMDADGETPVLPPFEVSTGDELRELGNAFTRLQDSALKIAVDQHRADRETADMLINLGRRNQNLLGRMLGYVTELERQEQDPDVLSQLFRLDHATTRIRRNAESMLVLAGATQTRTWSRPVPVIDVVRAALSEIEEYIRVDLHHVEDGLVNGIAVADVVHLIAELVENATHFSPPTTQVTVIGQSVPEGYRLRVIDQGIGMTRRELEEANQRIQRADPGWSDAKLLGLYVVGRLARRRGIEVSLEASAGRGITASILVPPNLLSGRSDGRSGGTGAGLLPPPAGPLDPLARDGGSVESLDAGRPDRVIDLTGDSGAGAMLTGSPTAAADREAPVAGASPSVPAQWPGESEEPSTQFVPAATRPDTPHAASLAPSPPSRTAAQPGLNGSPPNAGAAAPNADGAAPNAGGAAPNAVPRRVRGAQLPDLGPTGGPVVARPDVGPGAPESLRWQLRSFQLDVHAARRAVAEIDDAGTHDNPDQNQRRPEDE